MPARVEPSNLVRSELLACLSADEVFGDLALLSSRPRLASAVAVEDGSVDVLTGELS